MRVCTALLLLSLAPSHGSELSPSLEALQRRHLLARAAAEGVGTGLLVQLGCATACADRFVAPIDSASLLWGIVVALCVFTTRDISGAHLNPAVTLAFCATGKHPWEEAPIYMLAQVGGAVVSSNAQSTRFPIARPPPGERAAR